VVQVVQIDEEIPRTTPQVPVDMFHLPFSNDCRPDIHAMSRMVGPIIFSLPAR
jgi:hypothetical protein